MQATLIRRILYASGLVAAIGTVIILYRITLMQALSETEPLPNPNGYEVFLEAAKLLRGEPPAELDAEDIQTRNYVAGNRIALAKLREGLGLESRVTINYRTNVEAYSSAHLPELSALKTLARTLAAEGLVARSEGRKREAMESFLDCMRLGQACSRGGVMIDGLVAIALERIGLNQARNLLAEIDGSNLMELTDRLETLRQTRTPAEEIMANENYWVKRMFGWYQRFVVVLRPGLLKPVRENFIQKCRVHEQVANLFLIESAIKAYAFKENENPARLLDLVPKYLDALPTDPMSQTEFVYDRATGTVKPVGAE